MKDEKQENTPILRMDSPTAKEPGESVFRLSRTMEITRKIRHQLKFETRRHFLRKISEVALLTTAVYCPGSYAVARCIACLPILCMTLFAYLLVATSKISFINLKQLAMVSVLSR
jgi:hypothetical protein